MSPVGPAGPLLAHIRAHALAWRRRTAGGGAPATAPRPTQAEGDDDWLGDVAREIVAIPADLPQRPQRAFRAYLQRLLARECGVQDARDPGFQDLVDRVIATMESDERLRQSMENAGIVLLRSGGAP